MDDYVILQLQGFTRAVWGNSNLVLFRDPDLNVEYINLGKYFQAFQSLFPAAVRCDDKILVRQEYHDALQALKGTEYKLGAYVTGQPGIGKTLFLIYMLVISLGEKRPVALEFPDGRAFYALFRESGFTIHSLDGGLSPIKNLFDLSDFMWALSDLNYATKSPSPIFLSQPDKIRVIQATQLREEQPRWSEEACAQCYVMNLWTLEEIRILANLLGVDVNRMTSLGEKWGYNPRYLLGFIGKSQTDLEIEQMYRDQALSAVERTKDMLLSISQNALSIDAPSKFYFCRPMSISGSEVNRTRLRAFVPTETICQILGEALQEQDNNVRLTFFRALSRHDETRSSAGYIYEYLFHSYFAAGKPIQYQWVWPGKSTSVMRLTDTSNVVPSTWNALTRNAPFFWVAPKNTPGIDSVLVLDDVIHVFQVMISSTHVSPIVGMKKVRSYLPPQLRDITWSVVFVGQERSTVASVADSWVNKLFFPTSSTRVSIAWAEVDPVVKRVFYMDPGVDFDDSKGVDNYSCSASSTVELGELESSSKGKKRAIEDVAEPDEAPKASTSRTRSNGMKKT